MDELQDARASLELVQLGAEGLDEKWPRLKSRRAPLEAKDGWAVTTKFRGLHVGMYEDECFLVAEGPNGAEVLEQLGKVLARAAKDCREATRGAK